MRIELTTNENWEVSEVIFYRDKDEVLEAFKVAVHNALMEQHLTEPNHATDMIDECVKKSSDEKTQYYSIGNEPPWIISFVRIPSKYTFALADKERNNASR